MAEKSGIEWTDATFNPWWGCAKVSPGCDHCYAERDALRYQPGRQLWGVDAERRFFGDNHWNEPLRWERRAVREGRRIRVFCASMADVFDNHPAISASQARARLWQTIRDTPHLDWLVLTKRIGNAAKMLPTDFGSGFPNLWLGISVVNQEEARRDIPKLAAIEADITFLSIEPMLEPVSLYGLPLVDWVIVGGESGHRARPMEAEWAEKIADQCDGMGVAFFFKQGSQANWPAFKDQSTFPQVLQRREWPRDRK